MIDNPKQAEGSPWFIYQLNDRGCNAWSFNICPGIEEQRDDELYDEKLGNEIFRKLSTYDEMAARLKKLGWMCDVASETIDMGALSRSYDEGEWL